MPIFMDRHIVPGIEAQDAAEAHKADLKVQDKFGCRCMTYWVDEERGNAFCLIDAPDENSVKKMHEKSHGLIPNEIIQVNSNVVEAFLGRIQDPEGFYGDDPGLKIFNDPAFRIILVSKTKDFRLLQFELGTDKASKLISLYNDIMRKELHHFEGREVELEGENFVASFLSVTQAVACAVAVQTSLHIAGELIDFRIGINAGMPVGKNKFLFGDTVKMAQYLCHIGAINQIMMASIIREIYKDDGQNVKDPSVFKSIKPVDENFLELLLDTLHNNTSNCQWGVDDFCKAMSMSKSKLYRKSIEITGLSPNELIREHRLLKSLNLLKMDRNITQTTFDVGFSSPSYFAKCFQERFGLQPFAYQKVLA